jgi:DNA replication protein
MKLFDGFQEKTEVTPLPSVLLTDIVQRMDDIAEIKTVLYVFWLLSRRKGYPQMITENEVLHSGLMDNHETGEKKSGDAMLSHSLESAVEHGVLINIAFERDGSVEKAYCINTASNRKAIEKIRSGDIVLPGIVPVRETYMKNVDSVDIYRLYEQNIGMITPIIAEKLKEAGERYAQAWIKEAFEEAVMLNKRNWRYIERILERWATEGKDDGKPGRHPKKERDPDRFIRGKYGHMVER